MQGLSINHTGRRAVIALAAFSSASLAPRKIRRKFASVGEGTGTAVVNSPRNAALGGCRRLPGVFFLTAAFFHHVTDPL